MSRPPPKEEDCVAIERFKPGQKLPCVLKIVVGASLSEPHIDEFAVNILYIYTYISVIRRAVSHFLLLFCVSQLFKVIV